MQESSVSGNEFFSKQFVKIPYLILRTRTLNEKIKCSLFLHQISIHKGFKLSNIIFLKKSHACLHACKPRTFSVSNAHVFMFSHVVLFSWWRWTLGGSCHVVSSHGKRCLLVRKAGPCLSSHQDSASHHVSLAVNRVQREPHKIARFTEKLHEVFQSP